jgi:AcrR family transcriptional regulator
VQKSIDPRSARSREALVEAMIQLLDERELSAITITDLVGRAEVTRPTFYQHFSDLQALARAAALLRLEAMFPAESSENTGLPPAEEFNHTAATVGAILDQLQQHAVFYRRVIHGAGAFELYDDFVALLETRILSDSPFGTRIRGSLLLDPADRVTILSGGLTWLIMRWLDSDFSGDNAVDPMARRIANAMIALSGGLP